MLCGGELLFKELNKTPKLTNVFFDYINNRLCKLHFKYVSVLNNTHVLYE